MPFAQIPPYRVTRLYLARELKDRLDWGQVGMPAVWQHATGKGVLWSVIDTGIDHIHATQGDLKGAMLRGRNFTPFGGRDAIWDQPFDGHGSHVAGIIAGRDGIGPIKGYAPDCQLLVCKALHNGGGDMAGIAAAVSYSIDEDAAGINMSLGGPYDEDELRKQIERATAAGLFVICAAGNEGGENTVGFPGKYPQSVAIAAVDREGNIAPYSSRGPEVAFAAPGSQITSCWYGGGHATIDGTSMAAPAISGVVACLIQLHRELPGGGKTPLKTREQLIEHLARHARDVGAIGRDTAGGWGWPDFSRVAEGEQADTPATPPAPPADSWWSRLAYAMRNVEIHAPAQADDLFSVGLRK